MSHQQVPGNQRVPGQDSAEPTRAEIKAENESLGDLLSQVSKDISVLMRQELELAKAELKETAPVPAREQACWAEPAWPAISSSCSSPWPSGP